MLTVIRHRPEPNPDVEQRIRAELQSLDSLLDIRWFPNAVYNPRHRDFEGRYSLICNWPQSDKRWEMVQSGEIGDAFDSLGWFCEDIHDPESVPVAPDSIMSKVLELLGKCDNTQHPWRERMKELVEKNAKVRKQRQQEVVDRAEDIASTLWGFVGKHDETTVERLIKDMAENE